VRLWNHPPHDLDCCLDRAALLTQEGGSANFDTSSLPPTPQTRAENCFGHWSQTVPTAI